MKTILITGSTGLIGKQFVDYFSTNGFKVVGIYRIEEKFNKLFDSENIIGIKADLMEENVCDFILNELERFKINPDYLINVATNTKFHKVGENGFSTRENMLGHYIINVIVPYELSFKLANQQNSKLKKIVNISSMYGIIPYNPYLYSNPLTDTPIQYSLAKSATIHLTKELAIRLADKDIQVNCISYGGVEGRVDEVFKEKFAELTPIKRMMRPEETVGAVEFLISDNSNYMTGHNLIVDGGRTIW